MKTAKKILSLLLSVITALGVCAAGITISASATKLTDKVYPSENNADINDAYYNLGGIGYFINNDGEGLWNQSDWFSIDDEGRISIEYRISAILADKTMSDKGSLGEMGVIINNVDSALEKAGLDDSAYPVELTVTEAKFVSEDGIETVFNDLFNITEMPRNPEGEGDIRFRILPVDELNEETGEIEFGATPEVAGWENPGSFNGGTLFFTLEFGTPARDDAPPSSGVTDTDISDCDVTVESDGEDDSPIGYKEDKTFTAKVKNLPEGAEIHWFVNGEDVGTGESYTVEDPTDDYNIYAAAVDADGNTLDETQVQAVKVRNGFLDRLKWFFSDFWNNIFKAVIDAIIKAC